MKTAAKWALFALVVLLLAIGPAIGFAATMQAQDMEGTTVTLQQDPCTSTGALAELPRLNQLLQGAHVIKADDLHAASVVYHGKLFGACWVVIDDSVAVLDDGGQQDSIFAVPVDDFRLAESI